MANIIKVRCNGSDKHVNEINLDKVLEGTTIARFTTDLPASYELQSRYVLRCQKCTEDVIVTREMIEDFRRRQGEGD